MKNPVKTGTNWRRKREEVSVGQVEKGGARPRESTDRGGEGANVTNRGTKK